MSYPLTPRHALARARAAVAAITVVAITVAACALGGCAQDAEPAGPAPTRTGAGAAAPKDPAAPESKAKVATATPKDAAPAAPKDPGAATPKDAAAAGPSASVRDDVERNTAAFDPAYFAKPGARHLAVFFEVADGGLKPADRPAEVRPGRVPHLGGDAGPVALTFKNAQGKTIGGYRFYDPFIVQTCDPANPDRGARRVRAGTIVECLVPDDPAITTLQLQTPTAEPMQYDVSAQVKGRIWKLPLAAPKP